jgi:3-methyladenine DNA glycosylase AlkD
VATARDLSEALAAASVASDIPALQRDFKTAPGDYGEGDVFIGVRVPAVRAVVRGFRDLDESAVEELLDSPIHEHRLAALFVLVAQFARANADERARISIQYVAAVRRGRVNNWDLVDSSAEFILGEFLLDRPRKLLYELAASESVWERRTAIIATFGFIKHGDASTTLEIADVLVTDSHDLIQKAVGWMLREIGKRVDPVFLTGYLDDNAARMPRTTLSYAIERLSPELRAHYRSLR